MHLFSNDVRSPESMSSVMANRLSKARFYECRTEGGDDSRSEPLRWWRAPSSSGCSGPVPDNALRAPDPPHGGALARRCGVAIRSAMLSEIQYLYMFVEALGCCFCVWVV